MKRLTIPDVRVDDHTTRRTMIDVEAVREHAMDFYWRLKAYEDTGLEPAMCANYKTFEDEAISKGVTFKRIVALMEADRAGRLVVLPCKVGDTVYILRRTFDGAEVVGETELWWDDIPQLGKTVFLTREEAEKALQEMEGKG